MGPAVYDERQARDPGGAISALASPEMTLGDRYRFSIRSELAIAPEDFWAGMSMDAVNAELMPLVRMTAPASWRQCPLPQWKTGEVLFRSVILLFGVLPVDVHSLSLDEVDPQRGFVERSSSWTNRLWEHRRTTTPSARGCVVTDEVGVVGRWRWLTRSLMPVYRAVVRHRHRRLRKRFGTGT